MPVRDLRAAPRPALARPHRWTPRMPVVRGVISSSTRARIEVVGARVDVAEDRRDLLPLERVSGRDERERGDDHLAARGRPRGSRSRGRPCRCTSRRSEERPGPRPPPPRARARAGRRWSASALDHARDARHQPSRSPMFGRPTCIGSAKAGAPPRIAKSFMRERARGRRGTSRTRGRLPGGRRPRARARGHRGGRCAPRSPSRA